ncbi:MAG TPA: CHAD domain-containing protein [Polyangiaceae bacterium]
MAYRLSSPNRVLGQVRDIALEIVATDVALVTKMKEEPDEGIHRFRRNVKRLRALIRLRRHASVGSGSFENAVLRECSRMLAEARRALVMLETFESLALAPAERFEPMRRALARRHRDAVSAALAPAVSSELGSLLDSVKHHIEGWSEGELSNKELSSAFGQSYAAARRALKRAAKKPSSERLHDFRKRVKAHGDQLELLKPLLGDDPIFKAGKLSKLGDLLGEERDLQELRALLLEVGPSVLGTEATLEIIAELQARATPLAETALEVGERRFAERPRHFRAEVTRLLAVA